MSGQIQRDFHSVEGRKIEMPERFSPDPTLMQHHRERVFLDATLASCQVMSKGFIVMLFHA